MASGTKIYIDNQEYKLIGPTPSAWTEIQSDNSTLYTISNDLVVWNNGRIVQYDNVDVNASDLIIDDGQYTTRAESTNAISVNLATAFPDKWAALDLDEHTIQIRAKNPGNYLDSDLSAAKTFTKVVNYTITYSLTNVNSASGSPTIIASNASAVKITLVKPTGYNLPNEVAITGVDAENWSYDGTTGIITISRPTANVTISAVGQPIVYTIATTTENATADPSNPTTIAYGTTVTLKFTFPADYTAPDDADVAVTGATKQWTTSTGTLVLSNPTANVTVRVEGVWELKELTGTYTWKETIPEATWTEQLVNFVLADGTSYKKMYWTDNGTTYNLYYDDMLEEGSETKVYSYDADEQTGTWLDPKYRIVNFTSEDVQYVHANFYNYVIANTTQTTQLSTPQNVTADGTVVSWDAVENATSYEVLANGASIGSVTQKSVDLETLAGWSALPDKTYNITIVAKAAGFKDSAPSAAVQVVRAYTDCLTFTGENGQNFTLKATNKGWDGVLAYSTDHNTWTTLSAAGVEMSSVSGKLYLRGSGNTKFYAVYGVEFVLSERAGCSGNIQTLLDYENPPTGISTVSCYYNMFRGCTGLTTAPELPATTLANFCYHGMFYGCTGLTTAPELPATTLANGCYYNMFYGCKGLTTAPSLPATTLANNCYSYMFNGCTSLTTTPSLPATTLANSCYYEMFYGCTGLTTAPKLPATTLADGCYYNMFYGCKGLTTAPKLPATTLANDCYHGMFYGCTSLKVSLTKTGEYQKEWRIPTSGIISSTPSGWNIYMLSNTGGTFTSNPYINTTYYVENTPV